MTPDSLTPFERGIDFIRHFRNRTFTIQDIADRYGIAHNTAFRCKQQVERVVRLEPAGYADKLSYIHGPCREKWRIAGVMDG